MHRVRGASSTTARATLRRKKDVTLEDLVPWRPWETNGTVELPLRRPSKGPPLGGVRGQSLELPMAIKSGESNKELEYGFIDADVHTHHIIMDC